MQVSKLLTSAILISWTVSLAGCGGGGGSSSVTGSAIDLPTEISAVSATEDTGSALVQPLSLPGHGLAATLDGFHLTASASLGNLPADCDYNNDQPKKFIYVKVLDIFSIIEKIFDAVRQTHWEDHIGDGPYRAMVGFKDNGNGGVEQITLEEWTILSTLGADTTGDGVADSNVLEFWIDQDGGTLNAKITIEEAPTYDDNDLVVTLGKWTIKANLSGDGSEYFMAQADPQDDGVTTKLTIQQAESHEGHNETTRAVIYRSMDTGRGVVEMPDWEGCTPPCSSGPSLVTLYFVYNANYLTVRQADNTDVSFDRTDPHEVCEYMLYDSTTGERETASHTWGFPVRTADGGFGYYNSYQGRHQVNSWSTVATGDTLTKGDTPPGQTPPTYTAKVFDGALDRIELVAGNVAQIADTPSEVFQFKNYNLTYHGGSSTWKQCSDFSCTSSSTFTSWNELEYLGADDQREIRIDDWNANKKYVYLSAGSSGAGFYEATQVMGDNGPPKYVANSPAVKLTPSNGQNLFVMIGGKIYIEYTGDFDGTTTPSGWSTPTGFVMKTLSDFDASSNQPTFNDAADVPYPFGVGQFLFIHTNTTNYQVTRGTGNGNAADYSVLIEDRRTCNPESDSSVLPSGNLTDPNVGDSSIYAFDTTPASSTYMMLKFVTPNSSDTTNGYSAGDLVDRDLWGLKVVGDNAAFGAGSVRYSWEYKGATDFWGSVTYLKDESDAWVILDDPLKLEAKQLATTNDIVQDTDPATWNNYKCSFDGHMQGVPNMMWELQKIGWDATKFPTLLSKNVRIPDGTEFTDADDSSKSYFCKATDVRILLGYVTAFPLGQPDINLALGMSLASELPTVSGIPSDTKPDEDSTELLYIQGNPVE